MEFQVVVTFGYQFQKELWGTLNTNGNGNFSNNPNLHGNNLKVTFDLGQGQGLL